MGAESHHSSHRRMKITQCDCCHHCTAAFCSGVRPVTRERVFPGPAKPNQLEKFIEPGIVLSTPTN
jgi:multimeric flavodoxin WrbA